jgi:hypothetical protein
MNLPCPGFVFYPVNYSIINQELKKLNKYAIQIKHNFGEEADHEQSTGGNSYGQ